MIVQEFKMFLFKKVEMLMENQAKWAKAERIIFIRIQKNRRMERIHMNLL
jgi:hypothetical protein